VEEEDASEMGTQRRARGVNKGGLNDGVNRKTTHRELRVN